MDITSGLQKSVCRLRALTRRANGDLELLLPRILHEMESDIERVRCLENALLSLPARGVRKPQHGENGGAR